MDRSPLNSSLLVAMPQLLDRNFRRTVMLLVHHDDEGTFGLVLNRPVELSAENLCDSLDLRWRGDPSASIHWGGPVATNTGWVLFDPENGVGPEVGDITQVSRDLCFAGSLDVLREVAEDPPQKIRLYLGYAGWGPGQLEDEMAAGAWFTIPLDGALLFDKDQDRKWEKAVDRRGVAL